MDSGSATLYPGQALFGAPHKPVLARDPLSQTLLLIGVGRTESMPMHEGDRVATKEMTAVVNKCAVRPSRATFRLVKPLESPEYKWIIWNWRLRRYETFELTAIGQTVNLEDQFDLQNRQYSIRK